MVINIKKLYYYFFFKYYFCIHIRMVNKYYEKQRKASKRST